MTPEPATNEGQEPEDIRPRVAGTLNNSGIWVFAAILAVGSGALFASLENHRATITTPAIGAMPDQAGTVISAGPELSIPATIEPAQNEVTAWPTPAASLPAAALSPTGEQRHYSAPKYSAPKSQEQPSQPSALPLVSKVEDNLQQASAAGPKIIYEAARAKPAAAVQDADAGKQDERVRAARFANPATTVPKGTVIQAVLETALDSTRAGLARAIISRDVYGFDGSKILIAKGSRLIGDYKADLAPGQSRALIQWQRLMRPDGVIINLDSPSADPLGRAGVQGKVNSHFGARFGGAIFQSALDIGVQVASNKIASGTSIYALPGLYAIPNAIQGSTRLGAEKVQPTLTVKQGTSVSVFVAKDLDFTPVDQ